MTAEENAASSDGRALVKFLLENRMMMSYMSILMIIYAVWATIEVLTNASGATWWPPETGIPASELYNNPESVQNINNGWVIGLGAVFGAACSSAAANRRWICCCFSRLSCSNCACASASLRFAAASLAFFAAAASAASAAR